MTDILTPVGRLVEGSVHTLEEAKDNLGKPKINQKTGKVQMQCYFSIAVPKTQAAWQHEAWGQLIHQVGTAAFPVHSQNPAFAWKVVDGDSTAMNKNNKRPCDKPGFKGNWVIKFSGGFLPDLVTNGGKDRLPEGQKIELGDYVQVAGQVAGNNNPQNAGVYLNHRAVCFIGYGERIVYERDYSNVGFGQGPLPAGVMAAPAPTMTAATAAATYAAAPVPAPVAAPVPVAPVAPVAVPPNPAILQAPPPPAPAKRMTPAATGSYEDYIKAGWTDAQLVQHGLMLQ